MFNKLAVTACILAFSALMLCMYWIGFFEVVRAGFMQRSDA